MTTTLAACEARADKMNLNMTAAVIGTPMALAPVSALVAAVAMRSNQTTKNLKVMPDTNKGQTKAATSLTACDAHADKMISNMMKTVIGTAMVPAHVNWVLTAGAMATGVVYIGKSYGITLSSDEGGQLVKQIFSGAGFWFLAMHTGSKFVSAVLQSTGLGYGAGVALDATISAAAAYAIGATAKATFRRQFQGGPKLTKQELGLVFRKAFNEKKNS